MLTREGKIGVGVLIVWTLAAYGFGRWSAPVEIHTEIKTVEVEKKTSDTETNRKKHYKTVTTETDKPDGTKIKTSVTTEDTTTQRDTQTTDNISKTSDTIKDVTYSSAKITVSGLASLNLTKASLPDYGLGVTKPILGPITIGLFGFKSGVVGTSLGLTF